MARVTQVNRRGGLSQNSQAGTKARRGRGRTARAQRGVVAAATSGLELLESRVMMSAVRPDAAFTTGDLLIGDDKSFPTTGSAGFSLGFSAPINFFGNLYNGVFVNNNGNVSFGARNSFYSNVDLDSLPSRAIAPFYANVDTRFAGSTVKYGRGTVDGHAAFGVDWVNVDFFPSSAGHANHNSFQLVLIDRSDLGAGNFDMEFNYDSITWESGSNSGGDANGLGGSTARVGWTGNIGSDQAVYQMTGSNVAGSFLDSNSATGLAHGHFMSDVDGRYVFHFRDGTWADAATGAPNTAPVVNMPADVLVAEGAYSTTSLDAAGSFNDPDADNWTATVDYGDGWGAQPLELSDHGFVLQNPYFTEGNHVVTVTVDDGRGGVGVGTMNFIVADTSAPVVDVLVPQAVREGDSVVLSASLANDTDFNDLYGYTYEWTGNGVADGANFNFHADDNGSYLVSLKVTDPSGNFTVVDVPLTVQNVAPVATDFQCAATVDEGGTLNLCLEGGSDVSSADSGAGLLYSFDFDGDGVFECCGLDAAVSHVYADGSLSHLVRARVTDKDGGYTEYQQTVSVLNVAPVSAGLSNSGNTSEGASMTFTMGAGTDPSSADMAAGLVYSFDLDGDGVYEFSGPSNVLTASFDDNGTHVVHARVSDKDGGYSEYTTTVLVSNVAPTATLSAPASGNEGASMTFALAGVSDPSAADAAAGFVYGFDFNNDGVYEVSGGSPSVGHVFGDNGTYTVHARVTDKDGGHSDYTTQVTVLNVAAAGGTFSAVGAAAEGSAVTVAFAGQVDPSAADQAAGFTYSFDFDGDGVYELSGHSASATHVYGDNGAYVVHGRVTDKDGGATTYATTVQVANVAPTSTGLAAIGTAVEGSTLTLRVDGVTDPSAADKAAGFTYSFDLNNDGVFDVTGRANSANYVFKQDGTYTVRARVTDKDGGYTDYTTSVLVANAAPVLTGFTNSASTLGNAQPGSVVSFSGSFTDAGVLDNHIVVIDWGDGTSSTTAASATNGKGSTTGTHKYAAAGVYTVSLKLSDDARPAGMATATTQVYVTGVTLQNGVLQIVGTNGNDNVDLTRDKTGAIKVKSGFAKDVVFSGTSVREIHATLGAGRDSFSATSDITQPIYLDGVRFVPPKNGKVPNFRMARSLFSERRVA